MQKVSTGRFRRSWKKTSLCTFAVLLPIPILLIGRFHITPQDSVPLAAIQRFLGINYASDPEKSSEPIIIGHRGSAGEAVVENTSSAIQAAIQAKVHRIEIDVRKAKDQLILFHDETVAALTGEPENEATKVRNLDLEELRKLQGAQRDDDQIISLKEALKFEGVNWVIDIKEPGIKTELLNVLKDLPRERIVLQGLFKNIQDYQGEGYELAYAAAWGEGSNKTKFLFGHGFIIERCVKLGPDLHYLSLPSAFVNQALIREVKAKFPGIQIWSWRGETTESWERRAGLGVDGLIVDDVYRAMMQYPRKE